MPPRVTRLGSPPKSPMCSWPVHFDICSSCILGRPEPSAGQQVGHAIPGFLKIILTWSLFLSTEKYLEPLNHQCWGTQMVPGDTGSWLFLTSPGVVRQFYINGFCFYTWTVTKTKSWSMRCSPVMRVVPPKMKAPPWRKTRTGLCKSFQKVRHASKRIKMSAKRNIGRWEIFWPKSTSFAQSHIGNS